MGVVIGKGEQVIASKTAYVEDPETGVTRQVIEGEVVPEKLLEGYRAVTDTSSASDGNDAGDDLGKRTRDELNEIAVEAGVEDPASLHSKGDVIDAIKNARGE